MAEEGKESGRIERMAEEKKDDGRWKRNDVMGKKGGKECNEKIKVNRKNTMSCKV